ncbi:MAG: hypothetical protein HOI23_08325 [Deltaproteobacteria bacterium]|jgi:hypothetical protein|nr:hypothetical protein [Deltaproteobacteria bacterium]MBT6490913.1 hypothetical protein [Deltaproteobacteria bacterium]
MEANKHKAVYVIIENERLEKPLFRRIGTAFVNKDQSLNVILEALPIEGRLHIREPRAHDEKSAKLQSQGAARPVL